MAAPGGSAAGPGGSVAGPGGDAGAPGGSASGRGERELDPAAAQEMIEYCYEQGWSDGLPLVPADKPLVDGFLAHTSRDPGEVIASLEAVGRSCTVELAAINAALAGCRPEYFPVVLTAFDAIMAERAARGGGWQSTSGPAPLIVVNGPVRAELGFNGAGGAFGPGFRANATVARAIGLIVRNAFGIKPQVLEQATQGIPGRWSICVAENEEESPWEPLSVSAGQPPAAVSAVSAMLTRTYEFVDNRHTQDAGEVLQDFADTISRTGSLIFRDTSCAVVFCPEHAQMLAQAGYSKADVQRWFIEHCGRTGADLRRVGKNGLRGMARFAAPDDRDGDGTFNRIIPSPRHVPVVVAGARNAGISMVVRVFGEWSGKSFAISDGGGQAGKPGQHSGTSAGQPGLGAR